MRRHLRLLLTILAIAIAILALRATVFRPRPIEVEVATVRRGLVEDAVTNSQAGTVKSRLRARVSAERTGRVAAIPRREGATVARGETMLDLDPSSARVQLQLAERDRDVTRAALESARAAASLARSENARAHQLQQQSLISEQQMDEARARLESAEAELAAGQARLARAESAVRLARDELAHQSVTAPFAGVVTQRFVEVGESVIPGQPVLELTSPERLYVSAQIDEIDIGRIRFDLPARVTLDPFPGVVWQGKVTRVSETVNDLKEQNRTLEVEVEIEAARDRPEPKPGTSADVQIVLDRHEGVLRVPSSSVAEGKRVLIAHRGRAVAREVKIGLKNWDWTEITSGLAEGDRVITNLDRQGLKAGASVAARERAASEDATIPEAEASPATSRK